MIPEDLLHGICRIELRAGAPTPTLSMVAQAETEALRSRDAVLHVFASRAEASAFMTGVALLRSNGLQVVQGVEGAEPIVLVLGDHRADRNDDGICRVEDHGGLAAAKAQGLWRGIANALPDGYAIEFGRDGAHPTFVVGGRRHFGLDYYFGEIQLRTTIRANAWRVNTALSCDLTTSILSFSVIEKLLKIEMPPGDLLKRLGHLDRLDQLVADEESRDEWQNQLRHVRMDPAHCRVVERMLAGWVLSYVFGSVVLIPPDTMTGERLKPVPGSLLKRLEGADLVRKPRHARNRNDLHSFRYEVGSLDGTAVRRPKEKA